mgnify:CR=1 FL=1
MRYVLLALLMGLVMSSLEAQDGSSKAEKTSTNASFKDQAIHFGGQTSDILPTSSWARTIYRTVSKDDIENSLLFTPAVSDNEHVNLFSLLMKLLSEQNDVPIYEFQYKVDENNPLTPTHLSAILNENDIPYTIQNGRFISVPDTCRLADNVTAYNVKEVWTYDPRANRGYAKIEAICPILDMNETEDTGIGSKISMGWIPFDCLAPYLMRAKVTLPNELKKCDKETVSELSMFEYIANRHYTGEIYQLDNSMLVDHLKIGQPLSELQALVEDWLVFVEKDFTKFK